MNTADQEHLFSETGFRMATIIRVVVTRFV